MYKKTRNAHRALVVTAALAAALAAPVAAQAAYLGFSDLDTSHWAVASGVVDWSVENKVVNGANGRWLPDASISRAEAAAVLHNAAGNPKASKAPAFTDAGSLSWAYDAVAWCAQEGIFTGNAATGNFDPWAPLTREQAAKVLMVREGGKAGSASSLDKFSDKSTVSSWATGPVAWAVEAGVINGVDTAQGRLVQGQRACTRAEFVAMLKNLEDDGAGTPGGGTGGGGGSTTDPDQGGTGGGATDPEPEKPGEGGGSGSGGGATDPEKPTDPDQGGSGGGTTDPETPAHDPYDIGNGDFILDADNYSDSGLDGQDCATFWAGGKYYNKINIGYITNAKTGERLHCKGALTVSDAEADFSVVKTYDFDKQTIKVTATGINKYHGTLSITCTFKKYSIVHTGAFLCKECHKGCNQYTPENDGSKNRLTAFTCTDPAHGAEGSHDCSLMVGKTYRDSMGDGTYRTCQLATLEQAVEAGLYCRNRDCSKYHQRLTASEVYSDPCAQVPSDPTVGAQLFEDHYL